MNKNELISEIYEFEKELAQDYEIRYEVDMIL